MYYDENKLSDLGDNFTELNVAEMSPCLCTMSVIASRVAGGGWKGAVSGAETADADG